ncbi:hypothetical protein [Acetanaerobacterium elongatum]|uniref:Uncharacterized protein n=1 Tax=Acetanaerobacterium elongatum TaxID=258515 RepID=A0A1G9Z3S9_9FIRM|nr:hypothetical protein [Acetanaerobacterium elongatum]SDN15353.1 hypothetical protein SAMN05192585_11264 [Acetanaerobacterium elongatum]
MYNIFIGDIELYGIEEFTETGGRDIETHSTLGTGAVPLYGDKDLRSWSISCELTNIKQSYHDVFTQASDIFAAFDAWLTSGAEQRLVVVNGDYTLSQMVILKNYKKPEKSQGVYDVSIELLEYKEVSVRTADIPYIQRPGKIPAVPKALAGNPATFTKKEDIDAAFKRYRAAKEGQLLALDKRDTLSLQADLSIRNDALLGEPAGRNLDKALGTTDLHTFQYIGRAYDDWARRFADNLTKLNTPFMG